MLGYWPVPQARSAAEADERPVPAAVTLDVHDLSEAVSIAAGSGVEDLIVGGSETPAPDEHELSGLRLVETAPMASPALEDGEWVEVEEEVEQPLAGEAATDFQDAAGIDEDIREIFVEEVGEEIASIREHLPAWKANPEDFDALKSVRRSFHTLKGSGRLVGAMALGEFSWKVENMLNRVLDRTIAPDANAQALVDHALAALPELHAALQGEGAPRAPLSAIMQAADKLAAGEPARVEDFTHTHKVRRMVRRWMPRAADVEAIPAAALAHAPALPPVDPMLLEILRAEVAQHLSTMRDYLAQADTPRPIDDAMVRAAHTLHGGVAMIGIPVLAAVLTPLESWFKRMRAQRAAPDAQGIAALRDAVALTDYVIAQFDSPQPEIPDATALVERLVALRDELPEASMADVLRAEEAPEHEAETSAPTHGEEFARVVDLDALASTDSENEAASRQAQDEAERLAEEQRMTAERAEAERLETERLAAEQAAIEAEVAPNRSAQRSKRNRNNSPRNRPHSKPSRRARRSKPKPNARSRRGSKPNGSPKNSASPRNRGLRRNAVKRNALEAERIESGTDSLPNKPRSKRKVAPNRSARRSKRNRSVVADNPRSKRRVSPKSSVSPRNRSSPPSEWKRSDWKRSISKPSATNRRGSRPSGLRRNNASPKSSVLLRNARKRSGSPRKRPQSKRSVAPNRNVRNKPKRNVGNRNGSRRSASPRSNASPPNAPKRNVSKRSGSRPSRQPNAGNRSASRRRRRKPIESRRDNLRRIVARPRRRASARSRLCRRSRTIRSRRAASC